MAFVTLIIATVWLRLVNLGYSNYQGDEIKALFLPAEGQGTFDFLMDQRKGPVQFLITYIMRFFDPSYTNEFLNRLPFAVAGILAVVVFYKLVELHWGKKLAFYSAFFVAVNGFFIAFSRIIQYQSYVLLFMVLALYLFSLASVDEKWRIKGIYLGFIAWAISILAHYDGIFIAPFALFLLYRWYKSSGFSLKQAALHLSSSAVLGGVLLAAFYIPFVFSISEETRSYWMGRLEGTGGKLSSSKYLFQVYNPTYTFKLYFGLSLLAGLGFIVSFFKKIGDVYMDRSKTIALFAWIAFPLAFMEILVEIPGTHIMMYLLPLTILLGIGIIFIEDILKLVIKNRDKYIRWVVYLGVFIVFAFLFIQSHAIFIDHSKEYPWENERFLVWDLYRPTPIYHLSLFGFPYQRHWDEIAAYINSQEHNGYFSTNERAPISRYYVPLPRSGDLTDFYVYILRPQSFTEEITNERIRNHVENEEPVKVFFDKNGREVSRIYRLPSDTL
jgi:4-amino-4-deoxy-L-arabinose transferase-like glycosyltransferase